MTTDPDELDPELDVELGDGDLDEDDADDDEGIPDGFVVEGDDLDDDVEDLDDDASDDASDLGAPAGGPSAAVVAEEPDDFEEDIAPVVRVPDEEDEVPGRRAGEFVCTRCFLVKNESQLVVRSRKVCRDCA